MAAAPYLHQQQQQQLSSLTPSALEAAILSKQQGRPQAAAAPATPTSAGGGGSGGAEEDGLGLLPFAVAEAALFDDSPAAAHALPLSVADFVLGDTDYGGSSAGGGGAMQGGLRDSHGSDFSDMLGQLLPGGSPLKPPAAKLAPGVGLAASQPVLNGAIHPRQPSSGSESGLGPASTGASGNSSLFGGPGAQLDRQQQLSMAAAAAWGPRTTHSAHSSLDSSSALTAAGAPGGNGKEQAPGGSSGSSSSDVLLPGLSRYGMAADGNSFDRSAADSWFERKGRQLV